MALSQMVVFNEYIMPATMDTLSQMVDKFNAASGGAIRLTTGSFTGDFMQESFFASLQTAQRRVDRYAANTAATVTDLTQYKHSAVKVAGGFGPARFEPSQLTWLTHPTALGVEVISRNIANYILSDQLNTAILALRAAILNQAALVNDVSATAGITQAGLNDAHAKFGDHSGNIIAHIITGPAYHKLIGRNLENSSQLFQAQNVRVVDVLGKMMVVTDAPALYIAGAPNKTVALGLVDGACTVSDGGNMIANIETTNGNLRIETTMQVDYDFALSLKGYTWDETNGGKSPSDAALGTGSNWDIQGSSTKHTAGVALVADAAL